MDFKINGKKIKMISLLLFTKTDYDQLISWVKDEEMLMQFAGPSFTFPLTAAQIELSLADKNRVAYKIVHNADQTTFGHAEIALQEPGVALLSRIFIGDMAYREKGLALPIVNKLLDLAFNQPGIEHASLNVFNWNIPAIKSYKKAGFVVNEGKTLTRYIKDQTWIALNMRLDKTTWQQMNLHS